MHSMVAACRDSSFTIRSQECPDVRFRTDPAASRPEDQRRKWVQLRNVTAWSAEGMARGHAEQDGGLVGGGDGRGGGRRGRGGGPGVPGAGAAGGQPGGGGQAGGGA